MLALPLRAGKLCTFFDITARQRPSRQDPGSPPRIAKTLRRSAAHCTNCTVFFVAQCNPPLPFSVILGLVPRIQRLDADRGHGAFQPQTSRFWILVTGPRMKRNVEAAPYR
jgi:hypothetical protein